MIGRIKNSIRAEYDYFKRHRHYQTLKRVGAIRSAKLKTARVLGKLAPYSFPLHSDPIIRDSIKYIIDLHGIETIVETGTFLGSSTKLFASTSPTVKVFTSEINESSYKKAKRNLSHLRNVYLFYGSSPDFLEHLLKKDLLKGIPLFYLDAHWLDDWPLERELEIISKDIKKAIIIIDDFKVLDDGRFKYDSYNGKECSLDLVVPNLNKKNKYNILFPNYSEEDIFRKEVSHPKLVGYTIIFQNMEHEFEDFMRTEKARRFYKDETELLRRLIIKKR